ncbi:MAG: hypothetical protein M0C28_34205 [Candidatus Moduliflexus flocculans]|nr:hypothetical protein [Candidatus Moduliflexus flocculans]
MSADRIVQEAVHATSVPGGELCRHHADKARGQGEVTPGRFLSLSCLLVGGIGTPGERRGSIMSRLLVPRRTAARRWRGSWTVPALRGIAVDAQRRVPRAPGVGDVFEEHFEIAKRQPHPQARGWKSANETTIPNATGSPSADPGCADDKNASYTARTWLTTARRDCARPTTLHFRGDPFGIFRVCDKLSVQRERSSSCRCSS